MKHTQAARTLTYLILETFRLNGAIISAGDALVKDLGLTSARWQVLSVLVHDQATVSEIARQMGLSRQNVQRIANRLIKDGFIETVENPAHRRSRLCMLSAKGRDTMEIIAQRQAEWANEVSRDMSLEELERTVSGMKEYRQSIQQSCEMNE